MNLYKISENKLFLFSSILLCLLINLVHPIWFLDHFVLIDPWFYYGTGEYFKYIKFHLSDTYYFRRWPINLNNLLFSKCIFFKKNYFSNFKQVFNLYV